MVQIAMQHRDVTGRRQQELRRGGTPIHNPAMPCGGRTKVGKAVLERSEPRLSNSIQI